MSQIVTDNVIQIDVNHGDDHIEGKLVIPDEAQSIVVFAHGSGSSRHSPRNNHVAEILNNAGFATLLIDMLTAAEDDIDQRTREFRFDIALLARRVRRTMDWVHEHDATADMPIGLFGASTGAGAALVAAAQQPESVAAVVSRGGRPDLADEYLAQVTAPTRLIVGGRDTDVIQMNKDAQAQLPADTPNDLKIVAGASHLFQEPGKLDTVADLAAEWFSEHLTTA